MGVNPKKDKDFGTVTINKMHTESWRELRGLALLRGMSLSDFIRYLVEQEKIRVQAGK